MLCRTLLLARGCQTLLCNHNKPAATSFDFLGKNEFKAVGTIQTALLNVKDVQYKFRFFYDVLWFEVNTCGTVSNAGELHGVVEHDILSRQLQQHRIVEEFIDADVLAQTLNKTIREISGKFTSQSRAHLG